jgi:HAE1 family hydrophobic/amphiphilic exporter-1
VFLFLAVVSAFAETAPGGAIEIRPLPDFHLPPRIGVAGESRLTLDDVLKRVLENDADLRVTRISREQAGYQVRAAQGAYDPVIGLQAYHTKAVSPVASILGGTQSGKLTQTEFNVTPTVSALTPWGGSYSFKFSNSRQQSDSLFLTLNPQYPATATVNFTQPLLRGLRFDPNRYRVEAARKNTDLSTEQLRQHVIERLTVAINAYWELAYARQNYDVQTEAVRLAQEQYESNRRQAEQGVLAPVDVVAAQTQVATFQQNAILAQQALTTAENTLKTIMLANRTDPMWDAAVVPETEVDVRPTILPLRDAVNQALASRPEMSENAIALDVNHLDVRLAKDQTKPQINAFANLSATGLSGVPMPAGTNPFPVQLPILSTQLPGLFVGNYGQSLSNLFGGNFPMVQVGVQVSLPLRNRTAEAQLAIAEADRRKLKVLRDQIGSAIEADVRNALQGVTSAEARLSAAALGRESAEEQYASEQRQFQAGASTVFLVLERQRDLIVARSREVRAKADLGEARAYLDRATANTIEAHGIALGK